MLTWGVLFGPGKGIEWVIDALVERRDLEPRLRYVVAGRTHPKVLAYEGDVYPPVAGTPSPEERCGRHGVFDNSIAS